MIVRLPANSKSWYLRKLLVHIGAATEVQQLDVTNCIVADVNVLLKYIGSFSRLRSLRCLGCAIPATTLLSLLQERLVQLEELEFSVAIPGCEVDNEIKTVSESYRRRPLTLVRSLRRVYAEVGSERHAELLGWLLHFCPTVTELHVHVASGSFCTCVVQVSKVLASSYQLEKFTFSSDIPPTVELASLNMTHFSTRALACANVSYWDFLDSCSCVWLRDLVLETTRQELSSQLSVVFSCDADLLLDRISAAVQRHVWTSVRCLFLVLLTEQPFSAEHLPMAHNVYLSSLCELFLVLKHLVELNVSSFHFGWDFDLTQLLGYAELRFLQALSTAPCGLHHPKAVHTLARACRELVQLDVRVERREDKFAVCAVCQLECRLDPIDVAELHHGFPKYRRRLRRLTLSGLSNLVSLRFLEHCKVDELHLDNCRGLSHEDFADIGDLLLFNAYLRCLVLRHKTLPFGTRLVNNLTHVPWLQYLCLQTEAPVYDDIAMDLVEQLAVRMPKLKYLHVHYRDRLNDTEKRFSWIRRAGEIRRGHLIPNGPCILCSTATFIGLAKPRNRGCLF
ncbi:uncharacterized protein [Dermacentor albipictus]|uniref:uncharacterized protein n=1 Tax=Dermacentor albipictus TaxID=60249 RepID=UPI0038FCEFAE